MALIEKWANTRRWHRFGRYLTPYLFISPWILGVLFFYACPILSSLYFGFAQYNVFGAPKWVGLRNYRELFSDQYFRQAFANAMLYVSFAVPGALLVGTLKAFLLNVRICGQQVFRTLALMPGAVAIAASAAVWVYIWNPGDGLLNSLLKIVRLPPQHWIADVQMVEWVFISITIYSGMGMLVFLASLQDVSPELYDSAKVDGANAFHQLVHITIPMITPAVLFNLLTGLIGVFQYFTFPMLMTEGGPAGSHLRKQVQDLGHTASWRLRFLGMVGIRCVVWTC